ncbi:MAG: hypothetical protein LBT13_02455 [Treponema sp.]|jgi:hypothetical protein|nr:hypothetical protein [Treponema sp.]
MGLLRKAIGKVTPELDEQKGNAVKNGMVQYYNTTPSFQGIILDLPGDTGPGIAAAVSAFGIALAVQPHRSMVLFPRFLDRELISRQLSKSLGTVTVFSFESDNPEGAFALAQPYL